MKGEKRERKVRSTEKEKEVEEEKEEKKGVEEEEQVVLKNPVIESLQEFSKSFNLVSSGER